jgi:hypothetical protein
VTGEYAGMGLETTRAPADAGAEALVPRREATGQSLAVSVLDLIAMRAGESAGSAIARSVELARHVEQWGYKCYWVAEHHSIQGLACSATPVLIGTYRGCDQNDSSGQRWSHAAKSCTAGGSGTSRTLGIGPKSHSDSHELSG